MQGFFHFSNVDFGVPAWPFGALVENAVNRQGEGVVNAAGQVAFTGYGNNYFWFVVADDFTGQCAAGSDRNVGFIGFSKFYQGINIASAALLTIVKAGGNAALAVSSLQAVGQQNKEAFRQDLVAVSGE